MAADEREQQIRELVEARKRHFQSNGFGLSKGEYAQWIKDGAAAFALHHDGADHLAYLLDALDAARDRERAKTSDEITPEFIGIADRAALITALAAAQAEVERLNTWDGLLSILDEHYPAEVFEKSPDPGARIVTLTRHLAAAREENGRLREALLRIKAGEPMDSWAKTVAHEALLSDGAALAREDGGNG